MVSETTSEYNWFSRESFRINHVKMVEKQDWIEDELRQSCNRDIEVL
jgi:hypothetical protein